MLQKKGTTDRRFHSAAGQFKVGLTSAKNDSAEARDVLQCRVNTGISFGGNWCRGRLAVNLGLAASCYSAARPTRRTVSNCWCWCAYFWRYQAPACRTCIHMPMVYSLLYWRPRPPDPRLPVAPRR